ncbi:MAG: YitT family protein [Candidatus Marinimicrobia bacterium]|nr:YitT family protein [Candidatus Neomarinimicrobiota bacterium]
MPKYKKKLFKPELFLSWLWFKNYSLILIGSFLVSIGYVLFIIPHNIVPGGIFGLSIIINHVSNLPIGVVALCINIPIFLLGIKVIGGKFGVKTVLSLTLCSGFIDGLSFLLPDVFLTEDILVSAIFGGGIIGTGIALVIIAGATTGGTDSIARIFTYLLRLPIGKMLLLIDGSIVLLGILLFRNMDIAPYSIISIFVIGKTIDVIRHGLNVNKSAFIVSRKHALIRDIILKMDCGGDIF